MTAANRIAGGWRGYLLRGGILMLLGALAGYWLGVQRQSADPAMQQTTRMSSNSATGTLSLRDAGVLSAIRLADVKQLLMNLPSNQRAEWLADTALFRQLVTREALRRSLTAAAHANDLHTEPNIAFLMQQVANDVLREAYLQRLMQEQWPADFPDDAQVRQFYEQNPDLFLTPERIEIWQIFLSLPPDAAVSRVTARRQQGNSLLAALRDGRITFARAAAEHSEHAASRHNNGYMGTLAVAELKPAFVTALDGMREGELALVRSDEGWHILRKGRRIAARQQTFGQVKAQAREQLLQAARQQFRDAVLEQAAISYPFLPSDNQIEQWRLELKTGLVSLDAPGN